MKLFVMVMVLGVLASQTQASLVGVFEVRLKVGETEFRDLMTVEREIPQASGSVKVEGTMTVPGVFTSALAGEIPVATSFSSFEKFNFQITARENGKEYDVYYTALLYNESRDSFAGRARLGDGTPLGTFHAVRLVPVAASASLPF